MKPQPSWALEPDYTDEYEDYEFFYLSPEEEKAITFDKCKYHDCDVCFFDVYDAKGKEAFFEWQELEGFCSADCYIDAEESKDD